MENSFQTSFIPKKPIMGNATPSSGGKTTSISIVVSVAILVVMILSSVGLFLYKDYLLKNRETLSSDLSKIKDSFDKDTIAELELYDNRMTTAKQILGSHIVLSPLFKSISDLTLSSIQYTDFSHEMKDNVFSVRMSGVARDYKSIALQADVFNTSKGAMFKEVIFSNITKDKNNYVTFDLDFMVDRALLSYANNIVNSEPKKDESTTINTGETVNSGNLEQSLSDTNTTQ